MSNHTIYAVMTGDLVGSKQVVGNLRDSLLGTLKKSFGTIEEIYPGIIHAPFEIHRGDSFQGVLARPELALHAAIVLRAGLREGFRVEPKRRTIDARIAVGIGTIEFLPAGSVSEGDGEAFRRSGLLLDRMKRDHRLNFRTPWPEIDDELAVECSLLDTLMNRWSAEQAQAVIARMRGLTQEEAAKGIGISQPAVRQRLKVAGWDAVDHLCGRYERVIRGMTGQDS